MCGVDPPLPCRAAEVECELDDELDSRRWNDLCWHSLLLLAQRRAHSRTCGRLLDANCGQDLRRLEIGLSERGQQHVLSSDVRVAGLQSLGLGQRQEALGFRREPFEWI